MRDALAERLLADVMAWSPADVARERPILQAMALLKYDEYQQFSPGMRFVESLALWLNQFDPDERPIAYTFVRQRLVFFSEAEMAHFAAILYPDVIRPKLLDRAANISGLNSFRVGTVAHSKAFRRLEGSTVFFGLSDGARVDQFRRSNRALSHEQIFASYDLAGERIDELGKWIKAGTGDGTCSTIVLLDDFAASGTSYVSEEDGQLKGKLAKFLRRIAGAVEWKEIAHFPETVVYVALYVVSEQALEHLESAGDLLTKEFGVTVEVLPVQLLRHEHRLSPNSDDPFVGLIAQDRYYDPSKEDDHTRKGGTDLRYGFAWCGLPVVLHHNTPNNSPFLLWAEDSAVVRALFPRFSRHRGES